MEYLKTITVNVKYQIKVLQNYLIVEWRRLFRINHYFLKHK